MLRGALSQAARWGWVSTNVAALATLGRRTVAPRSAMTAGEVRAVIEAAGRLDPAAGVAFRLAAITGARRAELCALLRADLDGDRLTIDSSIAIERSGSIALQTGARAHRCGYQDRESPGRAARSADRGRHRGVLVAERVVGPKAVTPFDRPLNPERLTSWWRLARRDAGFDPSWRLHDLRRWSATEAIGRGHDIRTVAGRLGHANPAMTLRTYAHALDGADAGVAAPLAASLDGEREAAVRPARR